jgi:hypothetical protein
MSQRPSGPIGPQAGADWPDDLWPDDDDVTGPQAAPAAGAAGAEGAAGAVGVAGAGGPAGAGAGPPLPPGWPSGTPRGRRVRPGIVVAVVVAATAAGAGVTAAAVHDLAGPAPGAGSGPSATNPGGTIGGAALPGGAAGPGGGPGPGGTGPAGSIFVIGTVTAVSRTSITISGPGHTITATVTSATRVTGKAAGIGGIKAGDHVSAQLTAGSGRVTAAAIADPAQAPAGGSLP